jgi:hypothetical protein
MAWSPVTVTLYEYKVVLSVDAKAVVYTVPILETGTDIIAVSGRGSILTTDNPHKNAQTTVYSRALLVKRVRE